MTPEEEKAFVELSNAAKNEQARRMEMETKVSQMSNFASGKEPNIIEYQLDVSPILDRIYHLLSGHVLKRMPNGGDKWDEPEDDRLKIFSDYGVKQLMNLLAFYITPNTLLSNFTKDTIDWKVKDFGIELADLLFNRYESFFYYPSPEELFDTYKNIVKERGLNISDQELYFKCVDWSRQELQSKFRHYPIIVLALVDTVHATYLRALNGEERNSLRKQYNIYQSLNGPQPSNYDIPKQKGSLLRPSTW